MNDVRYTNERIRERSDASSIALATGTLGLLAGSMFMVAAALSVYRLNSSETISFNPNALNWLGEVHLRLDPGAEAYGPYLSEASLQETNESISAKSVLTEAPRTATPTKRAVPAGLVARAKNWIKKGSKKQRPANTTAAAVTGVESQAAVRAEVVADPLETVSIQSLEQDRIEMQDMHQLLRKRFTLSMTIQPEMAAQVIAQMGSRGPQIDPPVLQPVVMSEKKRSRKKPFQVKPVEVKPQVETLVSNTSPDVEPAESAEIPVKSEELAVTIQPAAQDQILSAQSAPVRETLQNVPAQDLVLADVSRQPDAAQEEFTIPTAPSDELGAQVQQPEQDGLNSADVKLAQEVAPKSQTVTSETGSKVTISMSPPLQRPHHEYSSVVSKSENTQPDTNSPAPQSDYSKAVDESDLRITNIVSTQTTAPMIEAFDWVTPVSGGSARVLTNESTPYQGGWILAQALEHWPTLIRRQGNEPVPMLSRNNVKSISILVGAQIQGETGIVFGKVPAGWSVRISGRSERPVFFNSANQPVASGHLDGERYFAFINVAPGAQLLYLTNRVGAEEGAVGLAVQGGIAAYVDFSSAKKVKLTGRVFDGSDAGVAAMPNVSVRVLGNSAARGETDRTGRFSIDGVMSIANHPIYLETDSPKGYTHRYQLAPSQAQNIALYRISESMIQTFMGQLEGTISPESGLIIAAVPNLIANAGTKAKLTPSVRSLSLNPNLHPEVYTLSSVGQLQVDAALDSKTTRFLSLQVPEGPVLTRVLDSNKKSVWSEIFMVSPGVINMIGPN